MIFFNSKKKILNNKASENKSDYKINVNLLASGGSITIRSKSLKNRTIEVNNVR